MARHRLIPHPDSPPSPAVSIEVEAARRRGRGLSLHFLLVGEIGALRIPAPARPERADNLWQATCFEAFLRAAGEDAYVEYNLSPSGRWAAYAFVSHRSGMREAEVVAPLVEVRRSDRCLRLVARLETPWPETQTLDAGFSAVVEALDGTKSHWALAHPPGVADFHHPSCFAAALRAAHGT